MRLSPKRSVVALPFAVAGVLAVAPALAASGGGGVSITPPLVEHVAAVGTVGSVTVANRTGQAMQITVSAHPWIQSTSGVAVPNQRVALSTVRPSAGAFTLGNGATRTVSLSLSRIPAGGSLYGNVDVMAVPTQPNVVPNSVTVQYRLIQSLRLDPRRASYAARSRGIVVTGSHRQGEVSLAVTNKGNTVAPIGGSVHIKGTRGAESGTIAPVRILPGATVRVPVLKLDGTLPAGAYALTGTITQAGRRVLAAGGHFALR